MADSKNMVIKIVSDAKDFVKGMEDALKQIQSASQKAQGFDKIAEDAANLKEQLSKVTENLRNMESATKADATAVDAQIGALENNVDSLNRKFDSFRHTFGTLQETVKTLNVDNVNSQMEKMISNMKEVTTQYMLLKKESESFLSNKTNINDITNINQLEKAFNEAKFLFENFDNSNKKNLKNDYTKEYQEVASALFKYAEALIQVDDAYANSNNGNSFLSEDKLDSLAKISEEASKIIDSQTPQIRKAIETMFSSINVESFFQKQLTGTINSGTKGFLVKGAIEIPVKIKENAKLDISAEVNRIIDDAQKQIDNNPIKFNFEPIEEKDNKLKQAIDSYIGDISKQLQEQAQELNNVMGKILEETGIKDTQQNFDGMSTSIVQLLANLKNFSKEITDIEKANEQFNTSFSSENLSLYVKSLEEISNSFKNLTSAIDNISSKLNKNGLESQFEIIKNKYSNLDLELLMGEKKNKTTKEAQDLGLSINETKEEEKSLELIKEKKKQLRELFSLYSTYQARGGIRPISDLLFGEADEEKIKYINNEYIKYIKRNKTSKKKTDKTDLGSDIFIPSGILETDKEQLNEILSLLKDINTVLQNIGQTGINTSNNLKPLVNTKTNDNVNINSTSSKRSNTQTLKQKPIIPSKKKEENKQAQQLSQEEQSSQKVTDINQAVIESNKKLAESATEAAQAIQQEKITTKELTKEEKEKKINGLMYHLGNLNDSSKRLTHPFGDEIKSWFTGIKDSGRGWGDGTGLYATKDINSFSQKSLSDKTLERFYAIDTSDLNLYEAHAEETAKEFNDFIHHLEQFCISMGSNFEGFDTNLEGINEESLFSTAQKLFSNFNNIFKDFDSFYDWINQMITLVSKSGIKADGTINSKQMFNFKKEYGTDDIKTRFLKQLGYQGTDLSGTSFGGIQSGNVIFDTVDANRIVTSGKQIDAVVQQAKNNVINVKEEINKTIDAESKLEKKVEDVSRDLEKQNNEIKNMPSNLETKSDLLTTKRPKAVIKQSIQPTVQDEGIQKEVTQTENNIENSGQNILSLISNIKESLDGLRKDLKILAEMIVVIEGATEQKDYIGQINNIKDGITILNILVLELAKNIQSIDFNKINKLEISTTPFDNIVNSLKDIIDLIERVSGQASKSNLKSQFDYIQNLYNSMVNDKGKFVARGNKDKLQLMYSLYDKYKDAGGQMSLHRLSDSKSNQDKLYRQYDYYKERTKNNTSIKSTQSNEQLKSENEALKESVKILTEVINNKQKLSNANKAVAESAKSNAKEIENENQKLNENKEKTKENKESKKQTSPNFTMVGEPYGEEVVDRKSQKKTAIIPTNKFTMVGEGRKEDNTHTQLRPYKPKDVYEGEFYEYRFDKSLDPDKEENIRRRLKEVYLEEKKDVDERNKTVEEAQLSFKEKIEKYYKEMYLQGNNTGFQFAKSTINFDSNFNLKDATFTQRNPENKNVIEDKYITYFNKDKGELEFLHSNIKVVDNAEQRVASFTKELERNQREREKLSQWIASFNNKTSDNFKQTNQMLELNQFANDASLINEKTLQRAETLKTELETVYNDVVNNARRGSSSLSPIPNMMFGEVSRRTKLEKAQSTYNKLAINWDAENPAKGLVNVEKELGILTNYYNALQNAVNKYNTTDKNGKRIGNIVEVSNAYGIFNEQLNKVNEQLNRMKIINTEINGNKINNLNNWFKDMPDPSSVEGKIDKYGQVYSQFIAAQQDLKELTTNLNQGTTEQDAQDYENKKKEIHEIVLELEKLKKILSSDSMNINNQMGQVIEQNLSRRINNEQLNNIIDEYSETKGKIIDSFQTGATFDKEGNEFTTFTRKIKDAKGVVTEFEFTYNKAMGTVAVATKKIQEPENFFKTITDELTTKWRGLFTTLASFIGFYNLWGYFKQGINTIREFDTALTEMQKVSNETISTLQNYQKTTFDTADAIGATALQIQNSTADFMRLGESLEEASESAKVANILMNVSEFQSVDEATKSLIAMSAAYDDLSKMNIIDKLNEVGNNYAISTSEAATALQNSASALKTAGNNMDEALALITAGNAVVQDANKVGTGMRTIALRLTGTKSAKEALEDLGEETDSMLTVQSKLRDTIKEATAVASNNFKGFDILDNNGNYKSTYEIMLGIADVYDEIIETDKQFGRNNVNLLLESVAGKNRANIAASIFQNPELLREAYKSSQEANGSAIEENQKYMDSINGHIAQLQNAYQQMWANSMNRDTINYFIDLGKTILKVVDNVGLLGTAFTTIVGVRSIVGYQNGKGFAYELIKGSKEAIKALAKQESLMGSLASTGISTGKAIASGFSTAISAIMGIGTAIAFIGIAANAFAEHQRRIRQELLDGAKSTTEEWQSQKQSLSDYASQYNELKTKLDTGNLSEQETLEVKQQIYDIQKQITDQYGENVGKIDLINGELHEQLDIISRISQIEADKIWQSQDYQKGFKLAEEAMTNVGQFAINSFTPDDSTSENKSLTDIIKKYTQHSSVSTDELGEISDIYYIEGNLDNREKSIRAMIKEIEDLQKEYSNLRGTTAGESFFKQSDTYLEELTKGLDIIKETREEYEQIWLSGLNIQLNKQGKGSLLSDYQSAISNLESAYISGDTKQINKAKEAYEEATKVKNEFLQVPANNEFSALFDSIDTSVIDTKNKTYDALENIKKAEEINNKISRVDDYKQQKKRADAYYDYLGNLQKVGNIDNGNRPFIFWDYKEAKKQEKALESWGESVKDIVGSYSTVYGGSGKFDGVEIAFTPIINDGTGKGKLLNRETLNEYINTLIANAGEGWTNEELLKLDSQGLIIDGEKISNVLASIGSSMSDIGLTSEEVGELMHGWQAESIGYISNFKDEWKEAQKQGKTLDEFMENTEDNLQDTSKATGRYTKEQKNLAKALKEVANLNMDKVDAEMVFDENAQSSQDYKDALYDLLDAMGWTVDDADLLIDTLVDTGYIYGDVNDATISATDAYSSFSQEIATAVENVSKLNTVLTESVSGANISTQNLDAFKEMFGDDYTYALERTANGYHINAEKLQTLIDKQNALTNTDYQKTLDAQYDALKRCNEEIIKANSEQQDTSGLLVQRQNILQRIQDTNDLMMAYQASTSAYQTWVNAQSNGSEYDMYEKISGGFDTVKDLIDRGWSGDDTVRSFLDLIYGDSFDAMTASGQECAEMFDNLDKKIEGTSFSIRDFFQVDANGKLTSNGIFNFFDAVKEKQEELGKDWLTLDDEGNITDYNFGLGRDRDVAEALGMDVELVQSILRAAYSAGFEVNLDQPMWAMNELQEKAISAQEELEGFNEIDFEELYKHLDDEDAYETISGHIDDVYQFIQDVENSDLSPELKTKQIEQAQDMLSYLVALEREAADRGEIDLKATVVGTATDKISQLLNETEELPDELKEYNWDEITNKEGLQKARNYIAAEVEGGKIDASSAEAFLTILDQALYELGLIDEYEANPTIEGNTVGAYNQMAQAKADLEEYIAKVRELESKGVTIDFNNDPELQDILSRLKGTSELRAALEIDSSNEEILEMLESGETDAEVILSGDTSQLEKDISNATQSSSSSVTIAQNTKTVSENIVTNTTNDVLNFVDQGKEGRESAAQEMQVLDNQEITPKLGLEDEAFVKAKERTEKELEKLDNTKSKPSVELIGLGGVQSVASNMQSSIDAVKGKTVRIAIEASTSGVEYAKEQLQGLINKATEAARAAFTHIGNGANGTAHAQGTAFSRGSVTFGNAYAGGKWGLPKNQTALTGELGTEIVVRDGNWFTVGDDGAEFVNLKKGDINKIVSIYSDVYKINHLIAGKS